MIFNPLTQFATIFDARYLYIYIYIYIYIYTYIHSYYNITLINT